MNILKTNNGIVMHDGKALTLNLPEGIGVVDLGTLNWIRYGNNFETSGSFIKNPISNDFPPEMICNEYTIHSYNESWGTLNMLLSKGVSTVLYCKDTRYSTVESFVAHINGILLFYKKA